MNTVRSEPIRGNREASLYERVWTSVMLDRWDGVVFDLDETLVHLDVDWDRVERAVADRLRRLGVELIGGDIWTMLDAAKTAGVIDHVEAVLAEHEIAGAERSERLPLADQLLAFGAPVGICSLNCERACETALAVHDLTGGVDIVIGRDSVTGWKPDPEPLEATIAGLGLRPDEVVFVGDSARDHTTARRAHVDFRSVEDVLSALNG